MEVFLHLWDELDDLSGACRHLATSAVAELALAAMPLIPAATTLVAALLAASGAFPDTLRTLLRGA
jgi:hypothetical protein